MYVSLIPRPLKYFLDRPGNEVSMYFFPLIVHRCGACSGSLQLFWVLVSDAKLSWGSLAPWFLPSILFALWEQATKWVLTQVEGLEV